MATMGADGTFIDTNVLVYAAIEKAPFHAAALRAIRAHAMPGSPCWVSRQVMREYLCVLTRPQSFTPAIPSATVAKQVRYLETRFRVAENGPQVTRRLLGLLEQFPIGGKRIHDAQV